MNQSDKNLQTKKIAFKTLGCRLNQFETDSIVSQFHQAKYQIVDFNDDADVYVVNTCTVTNHSDAKSRQASNFVKRKNPDSILVLTGCMVNHYKSNPENFKDATYFIDNEHKTSIFNIVDAHLNNEIISPDNLIPSKFGFQPAAKTLHTRSFIKIQDGCDNFCTFCIVPTVRGRAISRSANEILDNIHKVLDYGYKEIVLTGVNIGRYEYENINFEKLLAKICDLDREFRIRISSIEPDGYGNAFFDLLKHPKICPHLHLCLQSGSDNILLQMRRMYSLKEYLNIIEKIRKNIPDFNFTTDIMVGFPGETEQDFEQSLKVIKEVGFSHIHTFKYSVRNGTRAARMENQIPEKVKTERSKLVREIADENKEQYYKTFIGKEQTVLTEKVSKNGIVKGYGQHFIPLSFKSEITQANSFAKVLINSIDKGKDIKLIGTAID